VRQTIERPAHAAPSRSKGRAFFAKPQSPPRSGGEATASAARKIWLLLELVRTKRVAFAAYDAAQRRNYRTFQRDLQQLRALGADMGFEISTIKDKTYVELLTFERRPAKLQGGAPVLQLLAQIVHALGEPVSQELRELLPEVTPGDAFTVLAAPQIIEGSRVYQIYERLKAAHAGADGSMSLVRFKYPERAAGASGRADAASAERTVEPHRVVIRSGSCYLIGYDVDRRAWRTFALDRFTSLPARAGTIQRKRTIPAPYSDADAVGFIKIEGRALNVTVELSAVVAAAAISRRWQHAQQVEKLTGGRARITFNVSDPAEVIRWAFGFGAEARIVAPDSAVGLARETAAKIGAAYS
jgi:predicted DNA-binding transcriptional regulator YafY